MRDIGIDLGSARTKVVVLTGGNAGQPAGWDSLVQFSGLDYDGQDRPTLASGPAAPGVIRCRSFTEALSPGRSGQVSPAWGGRSATAVTRDFLAELLRRAGAPPGEAGGRVAIAIPWSWAADPAGSAGPARLIGDLLGAEFGLTVLPPVNAAAAAVCYLAHVEPAFGDPRHVLVADAGARRVTFTLCARFRNGKVRVIDARSYAGDQAGVLAEVLHRAGAVGSVGSVGSAEDEFGAHHRLVDLVLIRAARDRRYLDWPLFKGSDLTAGPVLAAFEPLAGALRPVFAGLAGRYAAELDGARFVLTGGLAAFQPVRDAVADALGIRAASLLVPPSALNAAAAGAALIAAGLADPVERFPDAVHLQVHRVVAGLLASEAVTILPAGTLPVDARHREVARADGAPLIVSITEDSGELPVQVLTGGRGRPRPVKTLNATLPPADRYEVSVRAERGPRLCVVLRSVSTGREWSYPLPASGESSEQEEPPT